MNMTQEIDLERIEELVNEGISLQREGNHKEAIVYFDEAISIDKNMGGELDSNLLLLKNNSMLKLWLKTNVFVAENFFKLNLTNVVMKLVYNVTLILLWIVPMPNLLKSVPNLIINRSLLYIFCDTNDYFVSEVLIWFLYYIKYNKFSRFLEYLKFV